MWVAFYMIINSNKILGEGFLNVISSPLYYALYRQEVKELLKLLFKTEVAAEASPRTQQ